MCHESEEVLHQVNNNKLLSRFIHLSVNLETLLWEEQVAAYTRGLYKKKQPCLQTFSQPMPYYCPSPLSLPACSLLCMY